MTKAKAIETLNIGYNGSVKLRETLRDNSDDDADYLNDLLIALLTAIDALKQDNGWISVKDRLPEPKAMVLAHCTNGRMLTVGYFDKDLEYLKSGRVTHWRPLPEPPESEDDAE